MAMLDSPLNLPDEPDELKQLVGTLASEVKSQALLIEKLKHQLAGMRRHRFGASSEALDQLQLTLEEEEVAQAAETVKTQDDAPSEPETEPKAQPKRKPLPDHLPRHEEVLSPGENCNKCGGSFKTLGEDVTEELEYVPGRFVVNRIVRPHLARLNAVARVRGCWLMFWSQSMPITFPSIGKARFLSVRAWTCRARRWLIGLANQQPFWNPWLMPSGSTFLTVNRSLPMIRRSICCHQALVKQKQPGFGPTRVTTDPGPEKRLLLHGISSPKTEKANDPTNNFSIMKGLCMPTAMRGSMTSTEPAK